ncbi:hypothetical protein [Desulfonatronum sp. SC1]|uniref:hypothetical protein n=1 Tax=Desulfonatronum sp. SC1 TaxID=2109626 RepID=UPI000D2F6863|nr:hypothetical protein [Desulfonatronum sp. SC1]PTN36894.1 hypothetical protein C6366_08485 [Desulfonatronum sp. SC1]
MTSSSEAVGSYAMLLAFRSLEEVYVRGRTVHFVGNGHRFYGNIECESASDVRVGSLAPLDDSVLGSGQEFGFQLELTLDEDMARSGRERVCFQFTDREEAAMVHQIFSEVAASIRGAS